MVSGFLVLAVFSASVYAYVMVTHPSFANTVVTIGQSAPNDEDS